jgi:hypothetical protein
MKTSPCISMRRVKPFAPNAASSSSLVNLTPLANFPVAVVLDGYSSAVERRKEMKGRAVPVLALT